MNPDSKDAAFSDEELRSLAALWRSQRATDIEVAAARRRFALGARPARLSFGLRALALISVVMSLAGMAIAGAGLSRWAESRAARTARPDESKIAGPVAPAKQDRNRRATPVLQPSPDLPSASSEPLPALPPPRAVETPSTPVPGVVRVNPAPSAREPERTLELPDTASFSATPAAVRGAWTRLAEDLREGRRDSARTSVGELVQSNDPATRDAALLVRAQLDLADGRRAVASQTLEALAERGATEVIRKRARSLLAH